MTRTWRSAVLVLVAATFLAWGGPVPGQEREETAEWNRIDLEEWQWRARITPEAPPTGGMVEISLPAIVHHHAQPRLADLRVLAGNKVVPRVLRRPRGTQRDVRLEGRVYNQTHVPGKLNRATVDFGEKVMKDSIRVRTPGTNYKRRVDIEASQDAAEWQVLREGAFLFAVSGSGARSYQKERVSLPVNDFRYLRVTVHHDPDDPDDVPIGGIRAWHRIGQPAPSRPVSIAKSSTSVTGDGRRTDITLDLRYSNLPLRRLKLHFEDPNFYRYVTVWGRDRGTREVTRRLEGGGERRVTVPVPWRQLRSGHIFRYTAGGPPDESLDLSLDGSGFRFIQVRIHNQDNAPLRWKSARVDRYVAYLAFPPEQNGPYWLYFGNPSAAAPNYDLVHYADRLRAEGVIKADVENPESLRLDKPERVPFSDRYRWVLWIALLGAMSLIGWMIWRQTRNLGRE